MEQLPLPWLLHHGALVWKVALVALAGSGVGGAALAPRAIARRQGSATRKGFGEPLRSLERLNDGARVTLTGRLVAKAPLCQRMEDGAEAAAATVAYDPQASWAGAGSFRAGLNTRAGELALVVGDDEVELRGPVEVVTGSREVRRRVRFDGLPASTQERIVKALGGARPHFSQEIVQLRSLATGDQVRVSGVLRKEARDGESGYRSARARWTLVPVGEEGSVDQARGLLLAFEGSAKVEGPGALPLLRGALLGAMAFLAIFGLGGELSACSASDDLARFQGENAWVRELDLEVATTIDPRAHAASPLDTGLGATALAAATPFRREEALARYEDALGRRRDADATLVSYRAALAEQRGSCVEAATILASHGFSEQGAAVAERCGERFYAAGIHYTLGDFAKASALLEGAPSKSESEEHLRLASKVFLLSDKAELAASSLRAMAERLDEEAKGGHPVRVKARERAELARCAALSLEARKGSQKARESLREKAMGSAPRPAECLLLWADLLAPAERGSLLESGADGGELATDTPRAWFDRLRSEADPLRDLGDLDALGEAIADPSVYLTNPRWALRRSVPGVERAIAEAMAKVGAPEDRAMYARLYWALSAATFEIAAGEHEQASRWTKAALVDLRALNKADLDKLVAAGFKPPSEDALTPDFSPKREKIAMMDAAIRLDQNDVEGARATLTKLGLDRSWSLPTLIAYREKGEVDALKRNFLGWELIRQGESANWAITALGDGAALALWMTRLDREPGAYLRLGAPMIRMGKEELGRWLRHGYRPPRWHGDVESLLFDAVSLRAVADAMGDAEMSQRERGKTRRFREALLRRETAVILGIVERL